MDSRTAAFGVGVLSGAIFASLLAVGARWLAGPPLPPVLHPHPVGEPHVVTDGTPAPRPNGTGPRIYVDGVHGARHLFDRDNRRYRSDYHTVSGWYRLLQSFRTAGYSVDAEKLDCFDRATLDDYDVFIVGEQTFHARFMTDEERTDLRDWVRDGGGLFLTVEHTNAHYMADVFNAIADDMPIRARKDSICDTKLADKSSPDWVHFETIVPHPVTEGVRSYAFDNGCSLDTEYGVMLSSKTSWSDAMKPDDKERVHNGNKKKDKGERSGPLAGVAAFEYGKGRVVVIADHNGLTNSELYIGDHHRFALNAIRWLAHAEDRPELVDFPYPTGFDLFVHLGAGSEFDLHKKADRGSYRSAYGYWSKEPQLRPWAHETMRVGDEVLVLAAPTKAYSEDELNLIDQALSSGEPVVWLASLRSLESEAAKQLQEKYAFSVRVAPDPQLTENRPYEVYGPPEWTKGMFRVFVEKGRPQVHVEGLTPIVQLGWGAWHIEEKHWKDASSRIDLVSAKDVGKSRLYVIAPFDLFDDSGLRSLYAEGADVVRQQMAEMLLTGMKNVVGDTTVYED